MSTLFGLLLILLLLAFGTLLLKRGRWARRVGDTPHCPKCDYIITGEQTRCPECGTEVNAATVVHGERHRRMWAAWAGFALLGFGLLMLVSLLIGAISRIDVTPYKPLSWLLHDMGSGPSPAWQEISRRLNAGKLSENEKNAIVEKGMPTQKVTTFWAISTVQEFIAERYAQGKLTPAQEDRVVANLLGIGLKVRQVVGMKGFTPYEITSSGYAGPGNWRSQYRGVEWQLDDGPVQKFTRGDQTMFSQFSAANFLQPVGTPGWHHLRVRVEVEAAMGGLFDAPHSPPVVRHTHDLLAWFQAVDGDAPITLVAAPAASQVQAALTPELSFDPAKNTIPPMKIEAKPLPVDIAFDIFLRYGGKDHYAGSFNLRTSAGETAWFGSAANNPDLPPIVDIVLRTSEAAARQTIDIDKIWKGEIVFANVPVKRSEHPNP